MGVQQTHLMSQLKKEVEQKFQNFLYLEGLKVIDVLERESVLLLDKTLEQRRNESGFKNATPKSINKSINKTKTGITANFDIVVVDNATNKAHKVYHLVNDGVKDKTSTKTYVYPIINEARTTPNTLTVGSFKGFGGFRTQQRGKIKKGFEGRFFYKTSIKELLNKQNIKTFKELFNIEISK